MSEIASKLRREFFGKPKGVQIKCSVCGKFYPSGEVQAYVEEGRKYWLCSKCSWKRKVRQSLRF